MNHQSPLTQYHEAFWGEEFTSTAGYDELSRRNNDQKRFLKDFEDYLKNRSKLEQEYSKGLSHLGKALRERNPMGELENAWNLLVEEVDTSQKAHDEATTALYDQAENVKRLCRDSTARRETIENRIKQFHGLKVAQYKTVMSLSKTYVQKCRDHDQLADAYHVMDRGVTKSARELDKAKSKMDKSEDEVNKADVAYKNGVQLLEERRRDWEREMEQACREFQQKDEEQIQFMRAQMWNTMNTLSTVALQVDEGCERVRKALEICDVDEDIQRFIKMHATGTCRPAPILYQNYYDNNSNANGAGGMTSRTNLHRASSLSNFPPRLASPSTPRPTRCGLGYDQVVEDPAYSSVDPIYSVAEPF